MYYAQLSIIFLLSLFLMTWGRLKIYSPCIFVSILYVASYYSGYMFYDPTMGGASIAVFISQKDLGETLEQVLWLVICLLFGSASFLALFKSTQPHALNVARMQIKKNFISIPVIAIIVFILGSGVEDFFYRATYFSDGNVAVKSVGSALTVVSLLILGTIYFSCINAGRKLFVAALLVFYLITFLAYSTRSFSIALPLFSLGGVLVTDRFKVKLFFVVSVLLFPLMAAVPLYLRGLPEQGLFPLIGLIISGDLFDIDLQVIDLLNNLFLVNLPIAAATVDMANISLHYMLTSINPLPGYFTDWYTMREATGLNGSTPYSAPGELINFSLHFARAYYFLIGGFFAWVEAKRIPCRPFMVKPVYFSLLYLFSITSMQYSVRSSTRFLYYLLFVEIALMALSLLLPKKRGLGAFANG